MTTSATGFPSAANGASSSSSRRDELIRLREALEPVAEQARPTSDCPDPERIWAAVEGNLQASETRAIVDHVTSCLVCAESWEVANDMQTGGHEAVLEPVSEPQPESPATWHDMRWMSAAAAALVLLVAGTLWQPWQEVEWGTDYRGAGEDVIRPVTSGEELLSRQNFVLRWESSEVGLRYGLRVSWVTPEARQVIAEVDHLDSSEHKIPEEMLGEVPSDARIIWTVTAFRGEEKIAVGVFDAKLAPR